METTNQALVTVFVPLMLVFGPITAYVASRKGYKGCPAFFWGCIGLYLATIVYLCLPDKTKEPKPPRIKAPIKVNPMTEKEQPKESLKDYVERIATTSAVIYIILFIILCLLTLF